MPRMLIIAATAAALLLVAPAANAEPPSYVKHLMKSPVDWFTFGLFRIEQQARAILPLRKDAHVAVNYDAEKNIIEIFKSIANWDPDSPAIPLTKKACKIELNRLRVQKVKLGGKQYIMPYPYIANFLPSGAFWPEVPLEQQTSLGGIFRIRVLLSKDKAQIGCTGDLTSDSISYEE